MECMELEDCAGAYGLYIRVVQIGGRLSGRFILRLSNEDPCYDWTIKRRPTYRSADVPERPVNTGDHDIGCRRNILSLYFH
jgi:hypothetical protein